jgi:hypothetical protein
VLTPDGISLPLRDSLYTTKGSVRYVDVSFVGRIIVFQDEPVFVLSVGIKALTGLTVVLMSETPKRLASRRPSRPKPAGEVVPVARVKLDLMFGIVAENGVTDAGSTLPLWEAVACPKPMVAVFPAFVPLMVIRTGGRK